MLAVLLFSALLGVSASPSQDLVLKILPAGPAKCLDGSPAAYYINRNPLSDVWVVYFQGGGYCIDQADCTARLSTPLGTSTVLPPTTRGIDQIVEIYNGDPVANPDFAYANRVYVPYCSGDGLLGTRTASTAAFGWPFIFAGHHILVGVFADLQANYGFGTKAAGVEKLILGGRSAGGVGVLHHIDAIAAAYPNVEVKGYLNAAFFIDIDDYAHWIANPVFAPTPNLAAQNAQLNPLAFLFQPFLDANCAAANPTRPLYCTYGEVLMPHVTTPVFLAEAFFDSYQIGILHGTPNVFNTQTLTYGGYLGSIMRAYLSVVPARNGIFAPSCFTHGINFTTTVINGQTLQQTFSNWFFGNGLPSRSFDGPITPAGPSNPTCNAFPFGLQGPPDTFTDHGCVGKSAVLSIANYYVASSGAYAPIALLTDPGHFTASIWVKVKAYDTNERALISKRGTTGWTVSVTSESTRFVLDFEDAGHAEIVGPGLELNTWSFVAVRYDGTNAVLTVNGEDSPVEVSGVFGDGAQFSRLYVGRRTLVNENNDYIQDALVAEVGLWSRSLTNAEVTLIATGKARDVDVSGRIALAYPITGTLAQNVRNDRSSFLFKSTAAVVADIPAAITARCANPGPGLAGGQKK